jgi:Spy/CpxP family protein refolding chaperone
MKRFWLLALAVSVGLNVGLLFRVLSPGGERPGRDHDSRPPPPNVDLEAVLGKHLLRMTQSLQLDEAQFAAIEAVHEVHLPGIRAQRKAMEDLRRKIAAFYARPEIDPAEFRALVLRLGEAQERLDGHVTEAMLGEAAVLTLEQRRKYAREMPWRRHALPPDQRPGMGEGGR